MPEGILRTFSNVQYLGSFGAISSDNTTRTDFIRRQLQLMKVFVETRPRRYDKEKGVKEYFLGLCDDDTLNKWSFCAASLQRKRADDCDFYTKNMYNTRVHRRLCDLTLLALNAPQCDCNSDLSDSKLYKVQGFPTCFKPPLPDSLCGDNNVCGLAGCSPKTINKRVHSIRCDRKCNENQPFCEPCDKKSSLPRQINSFWTDWSNPYCTDASCMSQFDEAICINRETGRGDIDCLGPGTSCCTPELQNCKCHVYEEDGTTKVFRTFSIPQPEFVEYMSEEDFINSIPLRYLNKEEFHKYPYYSARAVRSNLGTAMKQTLANIYESFPIKFGNNVHRERKNLRKFKSSMLKSHRGLSGKKTEQGESQSKKGKASSATTVKCADSKLCKLPHEVQDVPVDTFRSKHSYLNPNDDDNDVVRRRAILHKPHVNTNGVHHRERIYHYSHPRQAAEKHRGRKQRDLVKAYGLRALPEKHLDFEVHIKLVPAENGDAPIAPVALDEDDEFIIPPSLQTTRRTVPQRRIEQMHVGHKSVQILPPDETTFKIEPQAREAHHADRYEYDDDSELSDDEDIPPLNMTEDETSIFIFGTNNNTNDSKRSTLQSYLPVIFSGSRRATKEPTFVNNAKDSSKKIDFNLKISDENEDTRSNHNDPFSDNEIKKINMRGMRIRPIPQDRLYVKVPIIPKQLMNYTKYKPLKNELIDYYSQITPRFDASLNLRSESPVSMFRHSNGRRASDDDRFEDHFYFKQSPISRSPSTEAIPQFGVDTPSTMSQTPYSKIYVHSEFEDDESFTDQNGMFITDSGSLCQHNQIKTKTDSVTLTLEHQMIRKSTKPFSDLSTLKKTNLATLSQVVNQNAQFDGVQMTSAENEESIFNDCLTSATTDHNTLVHNDAPLAAVTTDSCEPEIKEDDVDDEFALEDHLLSESQLGEDENDGPTLNAAIQSEFNSLRPPSQENLLSLSKYPEEEDDDFNPVSSETQASAEHQPILVFKKEAANSNVLEDEDESAHTRHAEMSCGQISHDDELPDALEDEDMAKPARHEFQKASVKTTDSVPEIPDSHTSTEEYINECMQQSPKPDKSNRKSNPKRVKLTPA